ncbi:MAG: hypothetical protein KDD40_06710, partial [Bdellovibrionales bacterium]|nr:hypothetical protein [Bdellovibrionales bacterium]
MKKLNKLFSFTNFNHYNISVLLIFSLFVSSCGDGLGNKQINELGNLGVSLVKASGDGQFSEPGQQFDHPIVISVVDPVGNPIPNVEIEFSSSNSDVTILKKSTKSDSNGDASTNIIAPIKLNQKFTVTAQVPNGNISVVFNLATYPEQLLIISDGPTYNFESEAVGATRSYAFTLSNTGDTKATDIFGQVEDLPFTFKGGSYPGTGGTCGVEL